MRLPNKEKAYQTAEEINDISLNYHLSHATVACEILLEKELKERCQPEINELNNARKQALRLNQISECEALAEKLAKLHEKTRFRIYVEYLKKTQATEVGRTVRIDNQIIIYLPQKLLDESRKDGKYTKQVSLVRELMAHELGHTILHTSQILETKELQGSVLLSDPDAPEEKEANWFAERLLSLRHDRNVNMYNDHTLVDYF